MWILQLLHGTKGEENKTNNQEDRHYLKTGLTTVGRKECDILVIDKSVSRKHADIEFEFDGKSVTDLSVQGVLQLIDKSKFGTFVNGTKCKLPKHPLQDGDEIRFGVNVACTYKVCYEPLVLFWEPDCLSSKLQEKLLDGAQTLGGHLNQEVQGNTHSVMEEITAPTRHLLLTLLQGIPCVSPAWVIAVAALRTASTSVPSIEGYRPAVKSNRLADVEFDGSTCGVLRTLFSGKVFVFLTSEQFRELADVVMLASGTAVQFVEEKGEAFSEYLTACVIKPSESTSNTRRVLENFTSLGVNPIDDDEIRDAIIHCDNQHFCVPKLTPHPPPPVISIEDEDDSPPPANNTPPKTPTTTPSNLKTALTPDTATRSLKRKRLVTDSTTPTDKEEPVSVRTDPSNLPPMLVANAPNLLTRPLTPKGESPSNFKRFRKGTSLSPPDSKESASRVIKCVLEEPKPTEEMDLWLKDGKKGEKEKGEDDKAAEMLWNDEPNRTAGKRKARNR